ncbi:hypothetical protein [Cytobacillus sp. IB215665]|uniref:hypothetical protein n=1 Tax=Cytobacillus sp. IB215665 TaxID=3097357 RepID=UPI002A1590D2|nr:hypothetical protein [Cytobacillus sp. IB215665]MDX8367844.1 hypothetical protein [Cytobacillus sp. IB215665]
MSLQLQFESYVDLCREIAILEDTVFSLQKEAEFWWVGGHGFRLVTMDNAAERVEKLNKKINTYQKLLDLKVRLKESIDKHLSKMKGLEYKVAYLRFVERKSLKTIAEELDYSYDHIRRVSSRIKMPHISHSAIEQNVI